MKKIKILFVCGGLFDYGGISSFIINYVKRFDYDKILIDYIVHGDGEGIYDHELLGYGSQIFHFPIKSKHPLKHSLAVRKFLKNNKYDIIHTHLDAGGYPFLKLAKKYNIQYRIAHSHNTDFLSTNFLSLLINKLYRHKITSVSTHNIACSKEAGLWLFGKARFIIFKNAIDIDKYSFDSDKRKILRESFSIKTDDFVIGHVGRFDYQKNHIFIIEMFQKFLSIHPKSKLILVGSGHLKTTIINITKKMDIINKVIFVDSTSRVNEFYNVFDLFILPSNFEGLGMTCIEAQANGLPCLLSDSVPLEAKASHNVFFLNLNIDDWVNKILEFKTCPRNRNSFVELEKSGYSIYNEAQKLETFYLKLIGE